MRSTGLVLAHKCASTGCSLPTVARHRVLTHPEATTPHPEIRSGVRSTLFGPCARAQVTLWALLNEGGALRAPACEPRGRAALGPSDRVVLVASNRVLTALVVLASLDHQFGAAKLHPPRPLGAEVPTGPRVLAHRPYGPPSGTRVCKHPLGKVVAGSTPRPTGTSFLMTAKG